MPLQLPTNIGPGDMKPHPEAGGKKRIQWFLYVSPDLIKKINQETNGPHIKMLSQDGKIKLLVSEYLKQALDQRQRGRTSRDTEIYKNKLLKRAQEIYSGTMDKVFLGALKNSLEGTKSKETPWGSMYQSGLIITKSKKKGNMFAKNPAAPWHIYDQDAMDPILEKEYEDMNETKLRTIIKGIVREMLTENKTPKKYYVQMFRGRVRKVFVDFENGPQEKFDTEQEAIAKYPELKGMNPIEIDWED